MVYRGFNQTELKKIADILERYQVHYLVSVPDTSVEFINDKSKRVDHRFMDNLMQIEIEASEFDKITSPRDLEKLFDLRIYREAESPFTEEELKEMPTEETPATAKPDKHAKLNQAAAILAIIVMSLLFLLKKGIF